MLTGSALIWTYVAAGFCVFMVANLLYAIWRGRNQVAAGKTWARTPGEVIESKVDAAGSHTSDDDSDCTPVVRYRYTVNGKSYESDRIVFGGQPDTTKLLAEKLVAKYPPGAKVEVFYDPRRPKNAVLESKSGIGPGFYWMLIVFGAVGTVLVAHSIAGKVLYTQNGMPMFAFLVPFAAFGLAGVLIWNFFDIRKREHESVRWPTVMGRITRSMVSEQIEEDRNSSYGRQVVKYVPAIQFGYRIGGRDYFSSTRKWGWDELYPDRERPEAIVAQYPKGASVPVYYNPAEPENAVLEPANRMGSVVPLFAAAVFALPGALFFLVFMSI